MSGGEIIVILLVFLLLFGADAIPGIARTVGKGMREFKKATSEIQREITESTSEIRKDVDKITSEVEKEARAVKKQVEDNDSG